MAVDISNAFGIESIMIANTNQIRTMAANARRWNLPYQMDFRVNTLLDHGGLHTLMFDSMASTEIEGSPENATQVALGTNLFLRVLCFYKCVGLTPDEPFSGFLTVRFRDYIWLQTPEGIMKHNEMGIARQLLPRDEWTPDEPDPAMLSTTGLALAPGSTAAYRFAKDLMTRKPGPGSPTPVRSPLGSLANEIAMRGPHDDPLRGSDPDQRSLNSVFEIRHKEG